MHLKMHIVFKINLYLYLYLYPYMNVNHLFAVIAIAT